MPQDYDRTLKTALTEGKKRYPKAPPQHHAAFANSVTYLVTGWSGGYGGPSCREHAVSYSSSKVKRAGQWDLEGAIETADPICYGPLTSLHVYCYRTESCFDDAPEDVAVLREVVGDDRRDLAEIMGACCTLCGTVLRHNNKSGVCTRCQRNKRTKKRI